MTDRDKIAGVMYSAFMKMMGPECYLAPELWQLMAEEVLKEINKEDSCSSSVSDQRLTLPLTQEELAESSKYINSLHVANRFRLMFGQPLLQETPNT